MVLDAGFHISCNPPGRSCLFKTIPNDLRQHPIAVAIIHCATVRALRGKLPDPSNNFKLICN